MVFDNERQRKLLLDLLSVITFAGKDLDILYEFKQQVLAATIDTPKPPKEK
jgi:hypothetical protein